MASSSSLARTACGWWTQFPRSTCEGSGEATCGRQHDAKLVVACPANVIDHVEKFVRGLFVGSRNPYPLIQQAEGEEQTAQLRFLAHAMVEGMKWAQEPLKGRSVRLDVYFVGRTPWLSLSADAEGPAEEAGE